MNQANQKQLIQTTNQGLLGIRQSEVSYYQSLTVAFGTQATLIGGFTYGVFTENRLNEENNYPSAHVLADCYWVAAAITIACSVHVIMCTMLLQVLGPGLALHGPVGSMARATAGMRVELKTIIRSFSVMIILFAVSTLLSCWMVMSEEGAIGCSAAFGIAGYIWYRHCERIYLRFYYDEDEFGFRSHNNSIDSTDDGNPVAHMAHQHEHFDHDVHYSKTKLRHPTFKNVYGFFRKPSLGGSFSSRFRQKSSNGSGSERGDDRLSRSSGESNTKRSQSGRSTRSASKLLSMLTRDRERDSPETCTEVSRTPSIVSTLPAGVTAGLAAGMTAGVVVSGRKGVVMEGYLTKRGGGTSSYLDFRSEPWERRYFTLSSTANVFIFKNRQEFRNDPKKPLYTRPLHLMDYYIEVTSVTGDSEHDRKSVVNSREDDLANPIRFQMTLVLREHVHAAQSAQSTQDMIVISHDAPGEVYNVLTSNNTVNGTRARSRSNHSISSSAQPSSARQQMYRDHWVLRCDTEEELQQWVGVIATLCPSCFVNFGDEVE